MLVKTGNLLHEVNNQCDVDHLWSLSSVQRAEIIAYLIEVMFCVLCKSLHIPVSKT